METRPLVTVVIVTRNREPLLRRAIASVVAQDYRPIEIVLVDNFSDVPMQPLAESAVAGTGITVQVVRNERMTLLPANRNRGIDLARGELVAFLDDDDSYLPHKLSTLVGVLDGVDLVYGNTRMMGRAGEIGLQRGPAELKHLIRWRHVHPGSFVVRRHVLDRVRFDDAMTTYEDQELMFRIFREFRVRHVDDVVAIWNRDERADQMTRRNWARAKDNWQRLCERFAREIDADDELARAYYGKMVALCVVRREPAMATRYLWKLARRGVVPRILSHDLRP